MSLTIYLNGAAADMVRDLAERLQRSESEVVEEAIDAYKQRVSSETPRMAAVSESMRKLAANPERWAEYQRELRALDAMGTWPEGAT